MMREEVKVLENDIDAELLGFILRESNNIYKRNIKISVIVNSIPLSHKEKKKICKHLYEKWMRELQREGYISVSHSYYFILKKVLFQNKYRVELKGMFLYHF